MQKGDNFITNEQVQASIHMEHVSQESNALQDESLRSSSKMSNVSPRSRAKWRTRLFSGAIFLYILSFFLPFQIDDFERHFFEGFFAAFIVFMSLLRISTFTDFIFGIFLNMANFSMLFCVLFFIDKRRLNGDI